MSTFSAFLKKNLTGLLGSTSNFLNTLNNDGINDYVNINTNLDFGNTESDFTICCWTKRFDTAGTYESIISNYQASQPRFSLYLGDANQFNLYMEQDGSKTYHIANNTSITGAQEAIGTKLFTVFDKIGLNGNNAKIYANAVNLGVRVVASRNTLTSGAAITQTGFRLLIEGNTSYPLKRNLDELLIIKKSGGLTQSEVTELYNSGTGKDARLIPSIASSIYRYFKFNTLYDATGDAWVSGTAYVMEEITGNYYPLVNFTSPSTILF